MEGSKLSCQRISGTFYKLLKLKHSLYDQICKKNIGH
jgi:hypothetical protein